MGYNLRKDNERRYELLNELDRVTGLLETMNVEKVILFGSLARGDVTDKRYRSDRSRKY